VRLSRAWEISGSVNAYVKHHFVHGTVSTETVTRCIFDAIRAWQGENGNKRIVELYNGNPAAECSAVKTDMVRRMISLHSMERKNVRQTIILIT
jgi:hypothetical protein